MRDNTLTISSNDSERHYFKSIWEYRELFFVLAWRDISVRYKQTVIGLAWSLLKPMLTMIIFTVIFSRIARLPSDGNAPYPLLVFAGMLPWYLFSSGLHEASNSLVNNSSLISKVYFPRIIIPASAVVAALIDFIVGLSILAALMLWYQYVPGWQIIALPFFSAFAFLATIGPGLLLTALNVKYRDFRYIIPFTIQIGLYISPVGFSAAVVPEEWRALFFLNPMAGIIEGFRWAVFSGSTTLEVENIAISLSVTVALAYLGFLKFRKMERDIADLL